ncbi:MAG: fibronectin type III domain-containing protein [Myxococcales bacterium]|nr:fibronectin type III domain-containing protein [Myxococcales bacterium]
MRPISLAGLLLGLALSSPVAAQDISVTIRSMEGRTSADLTDLASTTAVPVSQSECDNGAIVQWRFSGIDNSRSQLHIYYGSMCETVTVRNDTTSTACTDLSLEHSIDMNTQVDWAIPISDLIDCSTGSSGTRTIYVLAVDNSTSEVTGAGQKVSFPIAFDFAGPSAPSNLMATDAEDRTTLSWDASSDQITSYDVFFVEGGCDASGNVTTTAFDDPANPTATVYDTLEGTSSSGEVPLPSGLAFGSNHAIGLRGVDNAGNVGDVSVTCMTIVDVMTFWDAYCGSGSASEACTSSCAASPGRPNGEAVLWVLAVAALGFAVRRRIR